MSPAGRDVGELPVQSIMAVAHECCVDCMWAEGDCHRLAGVAKFDARGPEYVGESLNAIYASSETAYDHQETFLESHLPLYATSDALAG